MIPNEASDDRRGGGIYLDYSKNRINDETLKSSFN